MFQKLPDYLSKIGYKCPDNALDGPFQYAHETTLPSIEWKKQRPPIISSFANHMAGYRQGRTSWMDRGFYPVEERLGPGLKTAKDEVLMVDVGGGVGHDLKEFRTKHPQLPGRLILQDRAEIIDRVEDSAEIEPMVHDFYTLQPIKGETTWKLRCFP